jgi:tRNA nucleotidyltransferase (CCA-adding enzyme)
MMTTCGTRLSAGFHLDDALAVARERLEEFDPDQPRWPKGHPAGGRWRDALGISADRFLVGGAVRDVLMGIEPKDEDYVVLLPPEQIKAQAGAAGLGVEDLIVRDRLVGIRAKGSFGAIEIAPPRIERSTGPERHEFVVEPHPDLGTASAEQLLKDDSRRRDFTVNALYADDERIYDPTGHGLADVDEGVLRVVGEDTFAEDALRILRGLRLISTHGLKPTPETVEQMKLHARSISSRTQKGVSGTVQQELNKLLMGDNVGAALRLARDTGVLASLLPELKPAIGFDQESKYHSLTVDEHIFSTLEAAALQKAPLRVRLALLFHDAGKPETAWRGEDGRLHYYANEEFGTEAHEVAGARIARDALNRLGYPRETVRDVERLVAGHMLQPTSKVKKIRALRREYGDDMLEDLFSHRLADFSGKGEEHGDDVLDRLIRMRSVARESKGRGDPVQVKDLQINGNDLLRLGYQGRSIGSVLNDLLGQVMGQPELNEREWLLKQAQQLRKKYELLEAAYSLVEYDPDQPRHPRGTPGGRGGEWRDEMLGTPSQMPILARLATATVPELKKALAKTNSQLGQYIGREDDPECRRLITLRDEIVLAIHSRNRAEAHRLMGGSDVHRVVIVGGGPAGWSAALAAASEGMDPLLLEADPEDRAGGQIGKTSRIVNFAGVGPLGATGQQLAASAYDQVRGEGGEIRFGVRVERLEHDPETNLKTLHLSSGRVVTAQSVIVATGVEFRRPEMSGADAEGVTWGSYKWVAGLSKNDDPVIVVGGSNAAAQAAVALANMGRRVTLLVRAGTLTKKMSKNPAMEVSEHPNITVRLREEIEEIQQDGNKVAGVKLKSGGTLAATAIGFYIGSRPRTDWIGTTTDEQGKLVVNEHMQTDIPGVFAAGDVLAGPRPERVAVATGEGVRAQTEVWSFLEQQGWLPMEEGLVEGKRKKGKDPLPGWLQAMRELDFKDGEASTSLDIEDDTGGLEEDDDEDDLVRAALDAASRLAEYDPDQPRDRRGRWKRIAPGEYEDSVSGWRISRINYGYGDEWTAYDPNDRFAYNDPVKTLRDAKRHVEHLEDFLEYDADQPRWPKGSSKGGEWKPRISVERATYELAQQYVEEFYRERPPESAPVEERQKFWREYDEIKGWAQQPSGAGVRGAPILPFDPRLPDRLYHVTTSRPSVLASGHLRAGGAGGLGGDNRDQIVSMTTNREIAERIEKDMRFVAQLARDFPTPEAQGAPRLVWAQGLIERLRAYAEEDGWKWRGEDAHHQLESYNLKDWLYTFFMTRTSLTGITDPIFMSSEEELRKINPDHVGIVEIPKNNLDTGALLTDFDWVGGKGFGLDEVRLYGDVPLSEVALIVARDALWSAGL